MRICALCDSELGKLFVQIIPLGETPFTFLGNNKKVHNNQNIFNNVQID